LGLRVIKDLIVDMEPFFDHYRKIMPYLVNDEPVGENEERLQTPAQRACASTTPPNVSCAPPAPLPARPSGPTSSMWVPASLVNAHRFLFDSRDRAAVERLEILNDRDGVWRCRTAFNCTEACPRDIKITQAIAEIKVALQSGRID
jgi:succinate dehydrogenase / fumarate reductase, iron-sulfur subunit